MEAQMETVMTARRVSQYWVPGILGVMFLTSGALQAREAPTARTLGFVLTSFSPAMYRGENDCPQGLVLSLKDAYLDAQKPAERARLLRPENSAELETRYKVDFVYGPDGTNICQNPEHFPRAPQRMVQGKIGRGLNLDGKVTPGQDFVSPDGEEGIDNQLYRADGCTLYYRGLDENYGDQIRQVNSWLANGEHTTVIIIKGVDDVRNDPDVDVVIASSDDHPPIDGSLKVIPGGSFSVSDNPAWRHVTRGSIKDGVLTTEPVDVLLNGRLGTANGLLARRQTRDYRQARFRFAIAEDGLSITGLMGAYQPINNARWLQFNAGQHAAILAGQECAGEYWAMVAQADGIPDPATGKFTGISMALDVKGVAAFVFDRERERDSFVDASKQSPSPNK